MNTPFNLDAHRRSRPRPALAPPPERYFEQLPLRVMQRVQPAATAHSWNWLAALTAPVRTAVASAVVLGGFAAAFWLTPARPLASNSDSLARVPQQELLSYLLATDQRITLTDLAEVPGTASAMPPSAYWQASPDELRALLDQQPADEGYL